MEEKSNSFLETEALGKLMRKYAIPCIISLPIAFSGSCCWCSGASNRGIIIETADFHF